LPQRNPLFQTDTLTSDERRDEADKICAMLEDYHEAMNGKERTFVLNLEDGREVTPRMLFWLRDLKSKYAE
jgi:hypothetical protein